MRKRKGITLIELLVVIVFAIGFLASVTSFFVDAKEHSQWTMQQQDHHRTAIRLSHQFRSDCAMALDSQTTTEPGNVTLVRSDQTKVIYRSTDKGLIRTVQDAAASILERDSFDLGSGYRIEFQQLSDPQRVQCQVTRELPGVEQTSRIESCFEAVLGSLIPQLGTLGRSSNEPQL